MGMPPSRSVPPKLHRPNPRPCRVVDPRDVFRCRSPRTGTARKPRGRSRKPMILVSWWPPVVVIPVPQGVVPMKIPKPIPMIPSPIPNSVYRQESAIPLPFLMSMVMVFVVIMEMDSIVDFSMACKFLPVVLLPPPPVNPLWWTLILFLHRYPHLLLPRYPHLLLHRYLHLLLHLYRLPRLYRLLYSPRHPYPFPTLKNRSVPPIRKPFATKGLPNARVRGWPVVARKN